MTARRVSAHKMRILSDASCRLIVAIDAGDSLEIGVSDCGRSFQFKLWHHDRPTLVAVRGVDCLSLSELRAKTEKASRMILAVINGKSRTVAEHMKSTVL